MYPQNPQQLQHHNGGYTPAPPISPAQQQRNQLIAHVRHIRNELTQAFNPYSLQKLLDETVKVIEFMLTGGQVTTAQPNQVPGQPVNPLDTGKARVEFFGGAGAQLPPAPSQPVVNGDVQFTQVAGGAMGGQTVEFYAGPPGTEHSRPNPEQTGGQRIEFFAGPPVAAPAVPVSHNTVTSPPSAQLVPGRPSYTIEAGDSLPGMAAPAPMSGLPVATPFAQVMPTPARPRPAPPPETPQSREDLINLLPIPMLDQP